MRQAIEVMSNGYDMLGFALERKLSCLLERYEKVQQHFVDLQLTTWHLHITLITNIHTRRRLATSPCVFLDSVSVPMPLQQPIDGLHRNDCRFHRETSTVIVLVGFSGI